MAQKKAPTRSSTEPPGWGRAHRTPPASAAAGRRQRPQWHHGGRASARRGRERTPPLPRRTHGERRGTTTSAWQLCGPLHPLRMFIVLFFSSGKGWPDGWEGWAGLRYCATKLLPRPSHQPCSPHTHLQCLTTPQVAILPVGTAPSHLWQGTWNSIQDPDSMGPSRVWVSTSGGVWHEHPDTCTIAFALLARGHPTTTSAGVAM